MAGPDAKLISDAIKENTQQLKQIREILAKNNKKRAADPITFVQNHFIAPDDAAKFIHLALMDPGDPRPSCWSVSGIGRQFTITNFPEEVTCGACKTKLENDPLYKP